MTIEVTRQTIVRTVQGARFDRELRPDPDQIYQNVGFTNSLLDNPVNGDSDK